MTLADWHAVECPHCEARLMFPRAWAAGQTSAWFACACGCAFEAPVPPGGGAPPPVWVAANRALRGPLDTPQASNVRVIEPPDGRCALTAREEATARRLLASVGLDW